MSYPLGAQHMKALTALLALTLGSTTTMAQSSHGGHRPGMDHSKMIAADQGRLTEAGQATFSAIQEAVALLEADPNTDWSKVNIEALRRHLVDMDNVMTLTTIEAIRVNGGARFIVSGPASIVPSIQRMIAGHSMTMDGKDDWMYVPAKTAQGGTLEVTTVRAQNVAKIRALGFAGIITRGSHHQPHHYEMAVGSMIH